ncbi:MAG: DUF447 domain-containing protein [Planctomycetota bacterium]|nr:MAG: DUF447 domain-containing protein [Planctomycetota bacterium]
MLEGIVTTLNVDGSVNIAPMGPIVDESLDHMLLRPFATSTTYQNLKRTGVGVFHVTDDVELLAQAAINRVSPMPSVASAEGVEGAILADACRWYAFRVESIDDSAERVAVAARAVQRGVNREFFGFNRAKHAVVEAAILATRLHLVKRGDVLAEFDRLALLVQKTGAAAEHRALALLRRYVEQSASD